MSSNSISGTFEEMAHLVNSDTDNSIISGIKTPDDLKGLTIGQLNQLSKEIRQIIIDTVFKNGGHLASNLGVVELSIALHYIFDFARDSLVFDVSHQCYTHKILTGRLQSFDTLRQKDGLCGFTNPQESLYDTFHNGHSGTAVSTALGISTANKLMNGMDKNKKVVAVVGDASISNGMSFEALNMAGATRSDLLVVLNDNEMSIEGTVGSLANYLNRMRVGPTYREIKEDFVSFLNKIPKLGVPFANKLRKMKDYIKHIFLDEQLFELLGFKYFGPVNGHDLEELIPMIEGLKGMNIPRILHIVTQKGHGYEKAEENPAKYHGVSPGIILSDKDNIKSPKPSFTSLFGRSLEKIAEKDEKIIAISAAMPGGTGLGDFAKKFPKRFFDVGISEQHAVGFAAGLAKQGKIPVFAVYSTFFQRALDQVFHEACLQNLHIIFALDRGGIVGQDGPTHHGVFDIACLRAFPGIQLLSPRNGIELKAMLKYALYNTSSPVAIRYPRDTVNDTNPLLSPIKLGVSETLVEGSDIAIIGYGSIVNNCMKSAEILKENGISASVINARFAKPVDSTMLSELINKNIPIFTVEEHVLSGGFGSAVMEECFSLSPHPAPVFRIGLPDDLIPHGTRRELISDYGLSPKGIAKRITSNLGSLKETCPGK